MRIVKTVPVRDGLAKWGRVLSEHVARLADVDLNVELVEVPGVDRDEIIGLQDCDAIASTHAAFVRRLFARPDPPDAISLGCLLEPGLEELDGVRQVVTGEIEASIRLLAGPYRPIGFVASSSVGAEALGERIERHGLASCVAAIRSITADPLDFTDEHAEEDLATAMSTEVRLLGASGVTQVVGYGSARLLTEVTRRTGIPTHSPITASLRMTAAALAATSVATGRRVTR